MILLCAACTTGEIRGNEEKDLNENSNLQDEDNLTGYFAFVESPNAQPPKVRPPPYIDSDQNCQESTGKQEKGFVSIHNICGDLNKGYLPRNPMKQDFNGSPYPL